MTHGLKLLVVAAICGAMYSSAAIAQSNDGWQDLLAQVNVQEHSVAGNWSKTSSGLQTNAVASSRIVMPTRVPRDYDLQVEFTRLSGQHSVAVFFTIGTGRASFEVDAWGQHLAGIQLVDGQDCRQNSTRTENQTLQNNRKYSAEVRVRQASVTVFLDGNELAKYQGNGSDLSLVPLWQLPDTAQIAVGAYQSETVFHSIRMRSVSGESVATKSDRVMKPVEPPKRSTPSTPKPLSTVTQNSERRVLIVIADHHFFYREYADPRQELERAGFTVEVAAGNRNECFPHANSGQGGTGGGVRPDLSLPEVDPSRYEAIVFSGGWGASMYQFALQGRYDDRAYNGDGNKKRAANELISVFSKQNKYVCGICNGVSVLAWARVDGRSPLAGKRCTAPTRAAPSGIYNGRRGSPSIRWHVQQNSGRLVPAGSIGNPRSRADDVVVDGKIMTAEDDHSAREAGRMLAELLSK